MTEFSCVPIVSIQRDGDGTLVERHLSWAVLVDTDAVQVPGPVDWLRDPDITFEVLLASRRQNGSGVVERIRPSRVTIFKVDGAPDDDASAVISLDRPSRHRPSGSLFDPVNFAAALAADTIIWQALEALGSIDPQVRLLPLDAVLAPVAEWERTRREQMVRDQIGSPDDIARGLCCAWGACKRCMTCGDPWW